MWAMWILVAMISVSGYYSVADQVRHPIPVTIKSEALAGNMAVYRDAVLAYLHNNPGFSGSTISNSLLPLPTWGYTPDPMWANYIPPLPDKTVIIYASSLPPVDLTSEVVELSRNSILAGRANMTTKTLESPIYGDTTIPLTLLSIPDKSPVWLAYRD